MTRVPQVSRNTLLNPVSLPITKNLASPGTLKNLVNPGTLKNLVNPGTLRNLVNPGTLRNLENLVTMRNPVNLVRARYPNEARYQQKHKKVLHTFYMAFFFNLEELREFFFVAMYKLPCD